MNFHALGFRFSGKNANLAVRGLKIHLGAELLSVLRTLCVSKHYEAAKTESLASRGQSGSRLGEREIMAVFIL